ncbi:MAG: sulfotransferase [bacterium]|nr:sulfotransferase [bacterium]
MSNDGNSNPLKQIDRIARRWVSQLLAEMRRTRREIVVAESTSPSEPPIFLTGVHRSGTTLLRLIVDSHSRFACPPESFFLTPLASVLDDAKAMEGFEAMGFSREHVIARIRESASYFFDNYCAARHKPRWADKTPSYVSHLARLEELYGPACLYPMIYRHGLDASCSIAEMPNRDITPFVEACKGDAHAGAARYWSTQCEKMLGFQAAHPDRCHEIRYEQLASDPEPTVRGLFEFLGEAWEPEVLRFHEQEHDEWIGLQDEKAARSRGFSPSIGNWREQPRDVIERMLAEAGETMTRLGYDLPSSD